MAIVAVAILLFQSTLRAEIPLVASITFVIFLFMVFEVLKFSWKKIRLQNNSCAASLIGVAAIASILFLAIILGRIANHFNWVPR